LQDNKQDKKLHIRQELPDNIQKVVFTPLHDAMQLIKLVLPSNLYFAKKLIPTCIFAKG
jgi:hypothetical protein